MFLLNVLFCMLVFSVSEISSALESSSCVDCVSILSCDSGLDFVRRLSQGALKPESRQILYEAICGYDTNNPVFPKVCCSAFEIHSNIGLLPLDSCGYIDGSRITNGRTPMLYELPWMALIAYNTTNGGVKFRCGGSVINSRYILTAAHCVTVGNTFKNITGVRIGEFDISTSIDCQGDFKTRLICESRVQDIEVEEIIPHENFTRQRFVEDDIALLRLKEDIVITDNAAPICLPVYSDLRNTRLAGKNAIIAGWGIYKKDTESTKLLKAWVPILTGDNNCTRHFNRHVQQRNPFMEKSFCAGDPLVDSCYGDSGGPLIMESLFKNQVRLVQYGIHSAGPRECGTRIPDAYTDVTKYMDWILDNIKS